MTDVPPPSQPAASPSPSPEPEPGGSPSIADPPGSLLGRVFDLSFSRFVTPSIIKLIFLVGVLFATVAAVVVFATVARDGGRDVILALLLAPIAWFLYVLFFRVMCEVYLVLFRIEENTRR